MYSTRGFRLLNEHFRHEILLMHNAHKRVLTKLHDLNRVCVSDNGETRQEVFHH